MTRVFLACCLSLLVTAASAQTPTSPKPPAKSTAAKAKPAAKPRETTDAGPCRIGVIPITGNEFAVQQVGFTVFNNAYTPLPVDGWGLDDLVVSRVRAAAGGNSVRRIAYTKEDLARSQETRSLFHDRNADIKEFVQHSAGNAGCKRYVLVNKSGSQFSNTNQSVNGFGIVKCGNPIKSRVFLFALTYIRIYDGHTFELVSKATASGEDQSTISRLLMTNPIRGPNRELDEGSFPGAATEAGSNPSFRDGVRALLTSSLDRTLPEMLK
jgi:hypothetical protein